MNFFLVIILVIISSIIFVNYLPVQAQSTASSTNNDSINNGQPKSNQVTLQDPLGLKGDIQKLWANIITALLGFVGVASLVSFVYAGFMFLVSTGSPERVKKAKDIMLYAVIGVFVSMASYAILSFVFTLLEKGTGN